MQYFLNDNGILIIYDLIETIKNNTFYMSEIDGAIGDGDHGINMNKGFTLCKEAISDKQIDLSMGFKTLSEILIKNIGGVSGPLYGMFFYGMSNACKNKKQINSIVFKEMLEGAVNELNEIAIIKPKIGDKTMMDTIIPAVEAYKEAIYQGMSFTEALDKMKIAAKNGKDSTKELIANIGRASRLGERSRGFLDAGAVSSWLILTSMADSIAKLISFSKSIK